MTKEQRDKLITEMKKKEMQPVLRLCCMYSPALIVIH